MAEEDDFRGEEPDYHARAQRTAHRTPRQLGAALNHTCRESAMLPSLGDDAARARFGGEAERQSAWRLLAQTSGLAA